MGNLGNIYISFIYTFAVNRYLDLKMVNFSNLLVQISVFVIILSHRVKHLSCCHGNSNQEFFKNYYFCICMTDVNYIKYVENYSYDVMLEADNLL